MGGLKPQHVPILCWGMCVTPECPQALLGHVHPPRVSPPCSCRTLTSGAAPSDSRGPPGLSRASVTHPLQPEDKAELVQGKPELEGRCWVVSPQTKPDSASGGQPGLP